MDAKQFSLLVNKLEVGKKLPDAIYIHDSALKLIPPQLEKVIVAVGKHKVVASILIFQICPFTIFGYNKGELTLTF